MTDLLFGTVCGGATGFVIGSAFACIAWEFDRRRHLKVINELQEMSELKDAEIEFARQGFFNMVDGTHPHSVDVQVSTDMEAK
jgi:hypothetical protein